MNRLFDALSAAGWASLGRLAALVLAAVLVGLITGHVALVLACVLGAYALLQFYRIVQLEYWLRHRRTQLPPDVDGVWGEVISIVSRIYRRKQFHRSRVTSLLREFRRLTSSMPEGAVLLGPGWEILWFNRLAQQWLGLRRKRDIGIRVENLVRHPAFIDYLHSGEPEQGVVVQDADSDRWLSFHLVRSTPAELQLLIVRDVSHEQQLQAMRKDFVANASHELRTPLTVISGYLDALEDDDGLDAAWRTPVGEMRRQAQRMRTIIGDLLELSKLESEEQAPARTPVDIPGMLGLLRKEMLAREERPAEINLQLDSDALLLGAESELHSVASNLVTNAVKFTPTQGRVDMRWWVDEQGAHLAVRDTGVGIAPEHIPRLTERFYRVDAGRARSTGGSGLGLAIVKHALQRHGGTLQIESREGAGSTFTCHFPRARIVKRDEAAAAADAAEEDSLYS